MSIEHAIKINLETHITRPESESFLYGLADVDTIVQATSDNVDLGAYY